MRSSGFARNSKVNLEIEQKYSEPLTTNIIALAGVAIKPYLVPGMTYLKLKKDFSSDSNVGETMSGSAQLLGAVSSLSPF